MEPGCLVFKITDVRFEKQVTPVTPHCSEPDIQNKIQNPKFNSMSTKDGIQSAIQILNNLPNYNLQREKMWENASLLRFYLVATSAVQQLKHKSV